MRLLELPERCAKALVTPGRYGLKLVANSMLVSVALALTAEPASSAATALSDGLRGDAARVRPEKASPSCKGILGAWVDAADEAYGERAYDSLHLQPGSKGQLVSFDVTALARGWLAGSHTNNGIFLRATGGNGSVLFHGRTSTESGMQPSLELEWSDGGRERLGTLSETFLDCSSRPGFGAGQTLKVGLDQTSLLVFELPAAGRRELAKARLRLHPFRQYARGLTVGVFRPTSEWAQANIAARQGIAEGHPGDRGIGDDPRVILALSFEGEDWKDGWTRLSREGFAVLVSDDATNGFAPLSGKALKTTLRKGANTALNVRYEFQQQTGQEPEEIYFRYHLRFGEDWSPDLDGGKLPGIAGTYGTGGWGLRRSNGKNGWSLRGAFSRVAVSTEGGTATPIGSYAYHADMKGQSGEHWAWKRGSPPLLRKNRWYAVEQYVKLNTPGERDGVFRAWIDGELAYERAGLGFRDLDSIRIQSVWLNVFHGGTRPSPRDMSLYIDNVVVARHYIGPMQSP